MEKTLYFNIYSDYRSGTNICVYDHVYDEDIPDDAFEITFLLPEKGNRLYIINEYPSYDTEPIWHVDLENDDCKKVYNKIFSQIYDCMPFEITGYNSVYKDEGDYPEVSEEIRLMEDIGKDITDKIKENIDEYVYFLCILNNKGEEVFTKELSPIH